MLESHGIDMAVMCELRKADGTIKYFETNSKVEQKSQLIVEDPQNGSKLVLPFRSFTRNFLGTYMYGLFQDGGGARTMSNGGANLSGATWNGMPILTGSSAEYNGIQVGVGTNAVTPNDYALQSHVLHGSTVGKLSKLALNKAVIGGDSIGTTASYFSLEKTFMNYYSGAIDITESCLGAGYSSGESQYNTLANTIMYVRDVFPAVNIPAGTGKIFRYKIALASAGDAGLTNNFLSAISYFWRGVTVSPFNFSFRKTNNTTSNQDMWINNAPGSSTGATAVLNDSTHGMVLAGGNTAYNLSLYTLTSQRTHGTGTNQLVHGISSGQVSSAANGSLTEFTTGRIFTNYSSAPVNVKSMGIYTTNYSNEIGLLAYALIGGVSGIDIGAGDALVVKCKFSTTC